MTDHQPRITLPVLREDPLEIPDGYTRLREEEPVCPIALPTGDPAWLVTRHEDLKTVLGDRRFSRAAVCGEHAPRSQASRPNPDSLINMDPPRLTRIRQLAAPAFTAQRVERLRPRIQQIVDEILDEMAAATPPVDLTTAFARPLPLRVVCEVIGVPFADQAQFAQWTESLMTISNTAEETAAAFAALSGYVSRLAADRRANPQEDLLSTLTQATDAEGRLTQSELISLVIFLLIAGYETSETVLVSAVLNLLRHPDQLALLRADRSVLPTAVEELLRLSIPGISPFPRITTVDVEMDGVVIPAGSAVVGNYQTAMRDPSVFDDPERLDLTRTPRSQVFFGHGPHFCLGAPIARAEVEIGMWSLFERFPTLSLAIPPENLRWLEYAALGGYEECPVTWT